MVRQHVGKRPLARPKRKWEDNIKMNHQEVGGACLDWIELVKERDTWRELVNAVMNTRVTQNARNFLIS